MTTWDRFNIVRAYYLYAAYYHGGKSSAAYSLFGPLSRMRYRPSDSDSCIPDRLSDEWDDQDVRDILAGIIRRDRRGDLRHR